MDIEVLRHYWRGGTLSVIYFPDYNFVLHGVERTPQDSEHPCIPEGRYNLEPHTSSKFIGPIWAMVNESLGVYHWPQSIPSRSACLFGHVGNTPSDVEGCIALGMSESVTLPDGSTVSIEDSKIAVGKFQEYMTKNWNPSITLLIRSH